MQKNHKDYSMKRRRTKTQIFFLYLSWTCTVICIGVIWHLSAQVSSQSSELSGSMISKLFEIFQIRFSQHFIRKAAHALEYLGLCLLFSWSFHMTFRKPCCAPAFFSTAVCAAVDEMHQYFVAGRACQPRDVYVDCIGAAAGLLCYWILWSVLKKCRKEKRGN